ncbi:MAG: SDR family oxidoreductase [Deltaproteobacteria bacterium]|nr:SDR family oxidoreductase [Deltaproteobacteria bacterium]MBI3294912.1 SDR family oxidoreductase [Deltaproteobacteria bacterium]
MDLKLKGKRALVTGGSRGIGLEIARLLAEEGCSVVIASRTEEKLKAAAAQVKGAQTLALDLSDEKSIRQGVIGLLNVGSIDIVIVNSGGPPPGFIKDLTLEQWDFGYRIILRSLVILSELCLPLMKSHKWGRILSITSTSAVQIIPNLPISGTFRSGLSAFVKHAAKEVGVDGILINNLLPGPTATDRLKELSERSPETVDKMVKESALKRIAEPAEIARVAAFLVSGANTYMTGCDVLVDGGSTTSV